MGIEDIRKNPILEEISSIDGIIAETLVNLQDGSGGNADRYEPWPADEIKKFIDQFIVLLTKQENLYTQTGNSSEASENISIIGQLKRIDPGIENSVDYISHLLQVSYNSSFNNNR